MIKPSKHEMLSRRSGMDRTQIQCKERGGGVNSISNGNSADMPQLAGSVNDGVNATNY